MLGHRAQVQRACQLGHRTDDQRAGRIVRQPGHELAVDLEQIDRQVLEVVRPATARPKSSRATSQPSTRTLPAKARVASSSETATASVISKVNRARVDLVLARHRLHQPGQLGIAHGGAREVDVQTRQRASGIVPEQLDRAARDPPVDGPGQAEALGDGHELRRQRQTTVWIGQPQQQLHALAPAGDEVDDRLAVELEAVPDHRAADAVGPRPPSVDRRLPGLAEDRNPSRPFALASYIARSASAARGGREVAAGQGAHPELAVMRSGWPVSAKGRARNVSKQIGRDGSAWSRVALGKSDGELVSAEPGEHVALAQALAEPVGDRVQQLVARLVAERVVDLLEAVQVEHQRAAPSPVASGASHLGAQLFLEPAAVEQPGERVALGERAQRSLGPVALGEVGERADARSGPRRCRPSAKRRGGELLTVAAYEHVLALQRGAAGGRTCRIPCSSPQ